MTQLRHVFALADDLTGALEVGAKFAASGLGSLVQTDVMRPLESGVQCLCLDAELRHLDAPECEARTRELVSRATKGNRRSLYLKTDSTLRGQIGAQFKAVLSACPDRAILYVPAYPRLGRTVREGLLYVHGTPVEHTAFANDPITPVNESCLRAMISRRVEPPVHVVHPRELPARLEHGVYICDGESDPDIDAAARYAIADDTVIVAGPAAIAEALARSIGSADALEPQWPSVRSCLVVNGSKHPSSEEQCRRARAAGWPAMRLDDLRNTPDLTNTWSVLDLEGVSEQNSFARSAEIGRLLRHFVARWHPDALMIIGGDTCYGFLKALGEPDLLPVGEVRDGVPCSWIRGDALPSRDLCFISKAGGFGSPDLLVSIKAIFDRGSSRRISSRS